MSATALLCTVFLTGAAAPPDPVPPIPTETKAFFQWVVDHRAVTGLKRVVTDPKSPKHGLVYDAGAEDANIALVAATAYAGKGWSRVAGNPWILERATLLMDTLAERRANGDWGDGFGTYFGVHSFCNAVAFWKETGAVPEAKMQKWIDCARKTGDVAMRQMGAFSWAGDFANPEFYYLSGLAATWQVTGEEKYREEAARCIRRYGPEDVYPQGGVAYAHGSNPEPGYQAMVIKGAARYYEITKDPYGLAFLKKLTPYYPMIWQPAGLVDWGMVPYLKHAWCNHLNAGAVSILASVTEDPLNAGIVPKAAQHVRDGVLHIEPPHMKKRHWGWCNYHHTTFICYALRYWKDVPAKAVPARWLGLDENTLGVRSRWDTFSAGTTSRRCQDTLAECIITNTEPSYPLDSGMASCLFEAKLGPYDKGPLQARKEHHAARYFYETQWDPFVHRTVTDKIAVMNAHSTLTGGHWLVPAYDADEPGGPQASPWRYSQTWVVWKNALMGIHSFWATAEGGDPKVGDFARMRLLLVPATRKLQTRLGNTTMSGSYSGLNFHMRKLAGDNWNFGKAKGSEEPITDQKWETRHYHAVNPTLQLKSVPWKKGERVEAAVAFWPGKEAPLNFADPKRFSPVQLKRVRGLVIVDEPRHAWVVLANHSLRWAGVDFKPPVPCQLALFKRKSQLPLAPDANPAQVSLTGHYTLVLEISDAKANLDARKIAAGLSEPRGRWR